MTTITNVPAPAGARKSIYHPNPTDVQVLDVMCRFVPADDKSHVQMSWVMEQLGFSKETDPDGFKAKKTEVQRAIKWLNQAGKIKTHGRGRGTFYEVLVPSNDLVAVDPSTLGDEYRLRGGPTVKQIVRAVFNVHEPLERVNPKQVVALADRMFPEMRLKRDSFGQVFTNLEEAGELHAEGDGPTRRYWRGIERLSDAATVPEGFARTSSGDVVQPEVPVVQDVQVADEDDVVAG